MDERVCSTPPPPKNGSPVMPSLDSTALTTHLLLKKLSLLSSVHNPTDGILASCENRRQRPPPFVYLRPPPPPSPVAFVYLPQPPACQANRGKRVPDQFGWQAWLGLRQMETSLWPPWLPHFWTWCKSRLTYFKRKTFVFGITLFLTCSFYHPIYLLSLKI